VEVLTLLLLTVGAVPDPPPVVPDPPPIVATAGDSVKAMAYADVLLRVRNGNYFVIAVRTAPRPNLFLWHSVYRCDDAPKSVRPGHYLCESDGKGGATMTAMSGVETPMPVREVTAPRPFANPPASTPVTIVQTPGAAGGGLWWTGGTTTGLMYTGVLGAIRFGVTNLPGCVGPA
jgi:hypothetical protein